FFFSSRRRHTRFSRDWSSDVCSSDLGSWIQYRHCHNHGTTITPAVAIATRGALLFRFSSDPLKGGRPSSSHVAISLGDNRTVERSEERRVGQEGRSGWGAAQGTDTRR